MKVPYFDLKEQYASIRDEVMSALDEVCKTSAFVLGQHVETFEREFATYCEAKYCVAVNSGTSALHLALLALGIQSGDEVITAPNSFMATAEAISYTGATPVFADIDPRTANIDPSAIEAAMTPHTKAIIPVHLYGRPADLDPILTLAKRHNLSVVEDACQAHGARYRGKRVGALADAGAFSFYPGKNLGAYGEGGALVTNNKAIAEMARTLRSHGESQRYEHTYIGYNYRMDGFQGAILSIKLKYLDKWTEQRSTLAQRYRDRLADTNLFIPEDDARDQCVYHLFPVQVKNRDQVKSALETEGIATAIHYPTPIHLQKAYQELSYQRGSFPFAEQSASEVISLPIYPELSNEHVDLVVRELKNILGNS